MKSLWMTYLLGAAALVGVVDPGVAESQALPFRINPTTARPFRPTGLPNYGWYSPYANNGWYSPYGNYFGVGGQYAYPSYASNYSMYTYSAPAYNAGFYSYPAYSAGYGYPGYVAGASAYRSYGLGYGVYQPSVQQGTYTPPSNYSAPGAYYGGYSP